MTSSNALIGGLLKTLHQLKINLKYSNVVQKTIIILKLISEINYIQNVE